MTPWARSNETHECLEVVGHSALEMTMNVYGDVNLKTQRRMLDELDRALR